MGTGRNDESLDADIIRQIDQRANTGETNSKEERSTIINSSLKKSSEIQAAEYAAASALENHANQAVDEFKGGRSVAMASAAGAIKEARISKNTRKTGEGHADRTAKSAAIFLASPGGKKKRKG